MATTMSSGPAVPERRSVNDRRRPARFPPLFSPWRRRKSAGRRKTDVAGYVDIYGTASYVLAVTVLVLSFLDAVFTVFQLRQNHIQEANPVMERLLRFGGVYTFAGVKAALTALPLAIIIVHKEWTLARFAARLVLLAYLMVTTYHVYLIILTR